MEIQIQIKIQIQIANMEPDDSHNSRIQDASEALDSKRRSGPEIDQLWKGIKMKG